MKPLKRSLISMPVEPAQASAMRASSVSGKSSKQFLTISRETPTPEPPMDLDCGSPAVNFTQKSINTQKCSLNLESRVAKNVSFSNEWLC